MFYLSSLCTAGLPKPAWLLPRQMQPQLPRGSSPTATAEQHPLPQPGLPAQTYGLLGYRPDMTSAVNCWGAGQQQPTCPSCAGARSLPLHSAAVSAMLSPLIAADGAVGCVLQSRLGKAALHLHYQPRGNLLWQHAVQLLTQMHTTSMPRPLPYVVSQCT